MLSKKAVESLYGRVVESVGFSDDKTRMKITFKDGIVGLFCLEGDCCSQSYFTEDCIKDAQDLVGGELLCCEEVESNDLHPERKYPGEDDGFGSDCVRWHFVHLITDKTQVTLDWRNDSNGYYDGSIELVVQ